MAIKPNGKSPVTSDHDDKIMLFRDVTPGPHETQLRFRLIHFWEAWNPLKKTLIGIEMLLIDEQVWFSPNIVLASLLFKKFDRSFALEFVIIFDRS